MENKYAIYDKNRRIVDIRDTYEEAVQALADLEASGEYVTHLVIGTHAVHHAGDIYPGGIKITFPNQ